MPIWRNFWSELRAPSNGQKRLWSRQKSYYSPTPVRSLFLTFEGLTLTSLSSTGHPPTQCSYRPATWYSGIRNSLKSSSIKMKDLSLPLRLTLKALLLREGVWLPRVCRVPVKSVNSAVHPPHFTPWCCISAAEHQHRHKHKHRPTIWRLQSCATVIETGFYCVHVKHSTDNLSRDVVTWNKLQRFPRDAGL